MTKLEFCHPELVSGSIIHFLVWMLKQVQHDKNIQHSPKRIFAFFRTKICRVLNQRFRKKMMNMITKRIASLFFCLTLMMLHGPRAFAAVKKKISVVIVGFGRVGNAVREKLQTDPAFIVRGLFTSKTCKFFNTQGDLTSKRSNMSDSQIMAKEMELISTLPSPFILVDTSSSSASFDVLKAALKRGGYVVTANKKHFSQGQAKFDELHTLGADRLFYNTTVGAGLPIIETIKNLMSQHAEILSIKGILSGTLGFVFSEMDKGIPLAHAVVGAYNRGFTEPHPKDDLSGMDVARKLLIMARVMGITVEPQAVSIVPLYSSDMEKLDPKDFMQSFAAKEKNLIPVTSGKRVRYVGSILKTGKGYKLETAVESVEKASPFFDVSGPENVIVIQVCGQTDPLIIRGAGAGVELTAERLCADLFTIKNRL